MWRSFISLATKLPKPTGVSRLPHVPACNTVSKSLYVADNRYISTLSTYSILTSSNYKNFIYGEQSTFLKPLPVTVDQSRTVTKFSLIKGKRKTVKCVLKRFKRLDWGIWIRTKCGRNKKKFKKSSALKRRLKQHVFVNATQSWLLDSMVTNYWRKPKYYVDDPYEQYHKREEYFATRKEPLQ